MIEYPDIIHKKVLAIALQQVVNRKGFTEEDLQTCYFAIDLNMYGF